MQFSLSQASTNVSMTTKMFDPKPEPLAHDGQEVLTKPVQEPPQQNGDDIRAYSLGELLKTDFPLVEFIVDRIIPPKSLTYLTSDGGMGKTTLSIQLACAIALGRPIFGLQTRAGKVVFASAEDPIEIITDRFKNTIQELYPDKIAEGINGVTVVDLKRSPILFDGSRRGVEALTESYARLRSECAKHKPLLLVVDNASNCFSGDPFSKEQVTAFITSLVELVDQWGGGVLMLGHINKSAGTYADSVAFHNAPRSRLFLNEKTLSHEKSNYGTKIEPIGLIRHHTGLLLSANGLSDMAIERRHRLYAAIYALIEERYRNGEWTSPSSNANNNAGSKFENHPALERFSVSKSQIFEAALDMVSQQWLRIEAYGPPSKGKYPQRFVPLKMMPLTNAG